MKREHFYPLFSFSPIPSIVLAFILVLAIFPYSAFSLGGDEGGISSSGGEFFSTEFNPWFLHTIPNPVNPNTPEDKEPVHYCVEVNRDQLSIANTDEDEQKIVKLVQNALNDWTGVISLLEPQPTFYHYHARSIETRFELQSACDGAQLRIVLGANPDDSRFSGKRSTQAFGPTFVDFDQENLQSGELDSPGTIGIIGDRHFNPAQFAKLKGVPQEKGFWTIPRLRFALLHQLGHIFGFHNIRFGVMKEDIPRKAALGALDETSSFRLSPRQYVRANWFYSKEPTHNRTCGQIETSPESPEVLRQLGVREQDIGRVQTICLEHSRTEAAFFDVYEGTLQVSFWGDSSQPIHEFTYSFDQITPKREDYVAGVYYSDSGTPILPNMRFGISYFGIFWDLHTFIGINRHLNLSGELEGPGSEIKTPLWIDDVRGDDSFFDLEVFFNGSYHKLRVRTSPDPLHTKHELETPLQQSGHRPWFTGERAVQYCIQHDAASFSIPKDKARIIINRVIWSWINTLEFFRQFSPEIEKAPENWISTRFQYQESCDGAELTIQLGGTNSRVQDHFKERANQVIGVSYQENDDPPTEGQRKPGVIYIAGDMGETRFMGITGVDVRDLGPITGREDFSSRLRESEPRFWSHTYYRLTYVFAHELGHIFGLGHFGGVMAGGFPRRVLERSDGFTPDFFPDPSDYVTGSAFQFSSHFCVDTQVASRWIENSFFNLDPTFSKRKVCYTWERSPDTEETFQVDFYSEHSETEHELARSIRFRVHETERSTYAVTSDTNQVFFEIDQVYRLKLSYEKNGTPYPARLALGRYGLTLTVRQSDGFDEVETFHSEVIDSPIWEPLRDFYIPLE